jgi:hypothetical protein
MNGRRGWVTLQQKDTRHREKTTKSGLESGLESGATRANHKILALTGIMASWLQMQNLNKT